MEEEKVRSGPSYSFRERRNERKQEQYPGPGKYDPNDSPSKDAVPSYSIGIKPDYDPATDSPGPGAY